MQGNTLQSSSSHAQSHEVKVVNTSHSPFCRLRPLSLTDVQLHDTFWAPRRETNRAVTLPIEYKQCEVSGRFDNFRRAAGLYQGPFKGKFFNDSDVYKWLEAASWTLATDKDSWLTTQVNEVIALISAAQDTNGYLNTYFTFERKAQRWTDLKTMHELYCAGHLIQAAIAHHRATRSHTLLDVAIRLANYITSIFGPNAHSGTCGHPEIEMAFVELYRETSERRYLQEAKFFIDQRGRRPPVVGGEEYNQDHAPFSEQHTVVGHVVRALYLYAGATDVYAETGDSVFAESLEALWHDLEEHKIYITGGAGSRYEGESFGEEYELPNRRAYTETCAAIAHVMWNWRMLLMQGEARFADALETSLYNNVLSGISLDGRIFFYQNPLADRGKHRRVPWFTTACCPPNIARLFASLPGYFYSVSDEGLWVHLYASNTVKTTLPGGETVTLRQQTDYPWDGEIALEVQLDKPTAFGLFLRIPSWSKSATLHVNDEEATIPVEAGSYVKLHRQWNTGDRLRLSLSMPVRLMRSHPLVINNYNRIAIIRGPLVYCVEQVDHPDVDAWALTLPAQPTWEVARQPELLGGVVVAKTEALAPIDDAEPTELYWPYDATQKPRYRPVQLTAIPYYAWANREPGPMQVWLPIETE